MQSTVWVQPTCLGQSSLNELASLSFQKSLSQPFLLTRLDSSVSNTLKEERKLGEAKSKGDSALSGELKQRAIFGHFV